MDGTTESGWRCNLKIGSWLSLGRGCALIGQIARHASDVRTSAFNDRFYMHDPFAAQITARTPLQQDFVS